MDQRNPAVRGGHGGGDSRHDVAIIGAGPAGSTLAALLAGRGYSVALIDRDVFPRDKLCGEFLSYDALPIADALDLTAELDEKGSPFIEHCRVVGRHSTYAFDFPKAARGASRMLLDDALRRRAIAAGATAITTTATSIGLDRVETDAGHLRARAVAGAWGRWGRFDTQLARSFVRDRTHRSFGFKRHYRSIANASADRQVIELYSFRGGYLGVNGVENDVTNICGLVHAHRLARHRGRWDSFVDTIRSEEPRLEALYRAHEPAQDGFLSSEPVIFRARSSAESGIFMIGDASGVIDPLTGNGMAMAMQSALLAAQSICCLLEGEDRGRVEDSYRSSHAALFKRRIAWSRRVAYFLSRPALLDMALRGVRGPQVGAFFLQRTRAERDDVARMVDGWFSVRNSQQPSTA